LAALCLGFGEYARAQGDQILSATESDAFRGHFDQNATSNAELNGLFFITPTSGVSGAQKGPQACVPTSVANSFVYLADQFGVQGLGGAGMPTIEYSTINTLASSTYMNTVDELPFTVQPPPGYMPGTTFPNAVNGLENYLINDAPNLTDQSGNPIAIQTTGQDSVGFSQAASAPWLGGVAAQKPTAQIIQQELEMNWDVEVFFNWANSLGQATGGGHCVDLYAINYDVTANSGSISFIDPTNSSGGSYRYGSGDAPALTSLSLSVNVNGLLTFQYSGGAAGIANDDNPNGATYGLITGVLAEGPVPLQTEVPEPVGMGVISLLSLLALRRR
jgi:hypothetical protein